ncbi:MAG: hypothetical protein ACIAQZ_09640 [Sedimentisphaeraceae bacterium JB056]
MKNYVNLILVFITILHAAIFASVWQISDEATTPIRTYAAPEYSDVCMSARWDHSSDPNDPVGAVGDFHATRMEWCYTTDSNFIQACKNAGIDKFNCAISSPMPSDYQYNESGTIRDSNGNSVTAPWMQGWDYWFGCCNNPIHRAKVLDLMKDCIDAGAYSLQFDDYRVNHHAVDWGGCYCSSCVSPAVTPQNETLVRSYYDYLQTQINNYAGGTVRFSCNNYRGEWNYSTIEDGMFYIGVGEIPLPEGDDPSHLYEWAQYYAANSKAQIQTLVSDHYLKNRRWIGFSYAIGVNPIVPWDVFIPGEPRFFGLPGSYAHMYGFVRGVADYLNGYEDAYALGTDISDDRFWSKKPVYKYNTTGDVYLMVRGKPGQDSADVVVHIVEWEDCTDANYKIRLDRGRMFGSDSANLSVKFYRPYGYNQTAHDQAQSTGDFSGLVQSWSKTVTYVGVSADIYMSATDLDGYRPWGFLVVHKEP